MRTIPRVVSVLAVCAPLFGQTAPQRPEFEVASIKPSGEINGPRPVNIGIKIDGAQFHASFFALKDYIQTAYRLKSYQVICPDWVTSERFDISAKIPEGVPRDKVPEMLQTLLEQRFGLKTHNEKKELPVYALVVVKSGKLKEAPPDTDGEDASKAPVDVAAAGSARGVNVNYGHGSYFTFADNKLEARKLPISTLVDTLARFLDRPVVDMTDLKGRYDLTLEISPEDYRTMLIQSAVTAGVMLPPEALKLLESATDESLHSALASVGLKLDPRKAPLDVLVVDRAEKTPIAN